MLTLDEMKGKSFSGRIAFLNPNVRGRFALSRAQPPLGLMSLMGVCRDLSIPYGYLDADAYDMNDSEVVAAIARGQCDYVGIPLFSLMVSGIFPLLESIKRETQVKLIVGGPLPTTDIHWLMEQCRAIDYAVLGEGEVVLPQLLLAIEGKLALDEVPGIAFWEGERLIVTPRNKGFLPGDRAPMPDFGAIDFRYYSGTAPVGAWPFAHLLVTRGCPFKCSFCSNPVWNHKPNAVPIPVVINWLEHLSRIGIREVFFVDDTLNINYGWFEELCYSIIKTGLCNRMVFKGPFRADLTDPEQLKLARKAGFWLIFYGVESGAQTILDYYQKGEKVEDLANAIEWTRAAGLKSQASMIAGAPIDTVDTLLETANFLRATDPDYAPTHPLIPYIGTKVANDIILRQILTPQEIREYDHTKPTIHTETLTTEELLEIIDFMRKDFVGFKKSTARAMKRRKELTSQGYDEKQILSLIARECKEADSLIPDGAPRNLSLEKDDPRLSDIGDELLCFTSDIRFADGQWHDCEMNIFRWSRPTFECPFFLKESKRYIEIHWSSMRQEQVDVKVSINDDFSLMLQIGEPEWRIDKIHLPGALAGVVWLKVEVLNPFLPPGDPRELGMAFQSIRFVPER
jgi:anaerobic magnesium-protoporphyrin IX monomethyl ester cyclase